MRRPGPSRQQGFGLLILVIATGIVAFSIVVGYSGMMTRKEVNDLPVRRAQRVDEAIAALDRMWPQRAYQLDDTSAANAAATQDVLDLAGIQLRGGAQAELSKVQTIASEGIAWRAVVVYYPSETDSTNPPDIAGFVNTGKFSTCIDASSLCAERVFRVFNSAEAERALAKETSARLVKVASKAQSYFKARQLQDPERNYSVDYFRKPLGGCETLQQDLGCMDTYTPLAALASPGVYSSHRAAVAIGLTDEDLFTAWGQPIEASNLLDSSTNDAPFSMSFRARKPMGGYIYMKALQQL